MTTHIVNFQENPWPGLGCKVLASEEPHAVFVVPGAASGPAASVCGRACPRVSACPSFRPEDGRCRRKLW